MGIIWLLWQLATPNKSHCANHTNGSPSIEAADISQYDDSTTRCSSLQCTCLNFTTGLDSSITWLVISPITTNMPVCSCQCEQTTDIFCSFTALRIHRIKRQACNGFSWSPDCRPTYASPPLIQSNLFFKYHTRSLDSRLVART